MRQIKFRGKDIDTKEWVYGDLIQRVGNLPSILFPTNGDDGKIYYCEVAVHRTSIQQYTGMRDNNGVDIYEGDILMHSGYLGNPIYHSVEWQPTTASFSVRIKGLKRIFEGMQLKQGWIYDTDSVIVGNVDDNPELIKL